ncbi:Arylamine N-acetyltransferase [Penicillium waksmanii]|uniref:Arylamine N-acetyltransferase n=1 Tax=Penicillium waksmanii TaxID=69791 RepID=UPI00254840E7|nr:Arylamine N-acetyltransferase [Penicillium waksmanii]KAJ5988056.1 Arylamine N-acetyltransferase [Penicillium waksmanii]
MTQLPKYTDEQLETYLSRISYPSSEASASLVQSVRQNVAKDALGTLFELHRRHLSSIPWGNSGLHYSQHHTISLNPETLFEKMVERRLDGYCMENTGLFHSILRSLGYVVYAIGARIGQAVGTGVENGLFSQLSHMALIVVIDEVKYMVDVGFGAYNATAPLLLKEGLVATRIAPSEMRLIKDSLVEATDKSQKFWIYQTRHNPESTWLSMICFADMELLPQDFELMNFGVSQRRASWFTQRFVCTRMILDSTGQEIIGQCSLAGKDVKRRMHGQTEVLQTIESEHDRVKALAQYFDMHLRDSEIRGIRGLASQIQ